MSFTFFIGQLNQQQFVAAVQRYFSPEELEEMLSFTIIPSHLLDEANMLPSLQASATNIRSTNDFAVNDLIGDDQLRKIAGQAVNKNWTKLALVLGFLEYDIEAYRARNHGDPAATVSRSSAMTRVERTIILSDVRITSPLARTRRFLGDEDSASTVSLWKWIGRA